jgi:hypothetical protein
MSAAPAVALVFSPDAWVEQLHRFLADHGGARVRQLVVDPAVLDDEEFDVLVVGDRWPALTPPLVNRLRQRGARVLGVFDPAEPAGKDHLLSVGVAAVVASDAPAGEIVDAISQLAEDLAGPPAPRLLQSALVSDPAGAGSRPPVLVVGAPGSGSTEVALALAVQLAARAPAMLFDARSDGAATGIRLGLPLEPNLRTAVDELAFGGAPGECTLTLARSGLRVLSGFPNESVAAQVSAQEVLDVVDALADEVGHLVILADGAVRDALAPRASLVAVSAPSPSGVARTTRLLAAIAPGATARVVVVNRAPRDRFRVGELRGEFAALPGVGAVCVLPDDRRVATAAWEGVVVGDGPFTRNVGSLVAALGAGPRPRRRGRVLRAVGR